MTFDIVRGVSATPELHASDDGLGDLAGHFSVFDTWYEVNSVWEGQFLERIAPGAFAQTIAEDKGAMRVMFEHGHDPQIGSKVLGSIRSLSEDNIGAAYSVSLFDTSYNRDLLPGLRNGQYGASFRFSVRDESWTDPTEPTDANPYGLKERTITNARVAEFGPVTFGANPAATAAMRSLTDQFYDRLKTTDATAYDLAARAAGIDLAGQLDARSVSGSDATQQILARKRALSIRRIL